MARTASHDPGPGPFFSDHTEPKPTKSYAAASLFGITILGVMMWAALIGASVDTTAQLRNQESDLGSSYRSAGVR